MMIEKVEEKGNTEIEGGRVGKEEGDKGEEEDRGEEENGVVTIHSLSSSGMEDKE